MLHCVIAHVTTVLRIPQQLKHTVVSHAHLHSQCGQAALHSVVYVQLIQCTPHTALGIARAHAVAAVDVCEHYGYVVFHIITSMYTLKLIYDPPPATQMLKETITYCASIELFVHNIHCEQNSASTLVFDRERDRTLAQLLLSGSTSFHTVCID